MTAMCVLLGACSGTQVRSESPGNAANTQEIDALTKRFQRSIDAQQKRITELESRLALLENEARASRTSRGRKLQETVTIGRANRVREQASGERMYVPDEPSAEAPIRLRLYGRPERSELPEEPLPTVSERLPVAPLPGVAAKSNTDKPAAGRLKTPFKARYVAALRMLRERKYGDAGAALAALQVDFPDHPMADNVTYWLGEVAFARGDYEGAARAFETVVQRYPSSDKLPDALFKAGLSHRQLGKSKTAEKYLTRVRSEFPESEVARLASAEGSR